jgi:hypothetical protein
MNIRQEPVEKSVHLMRILIVFCSTDYQDDKKYCDRNFKDLNWNKFNYHHANPP